MISTVKGLAQLRRFVRDGILTLLLATSAGAAFAEPIEITVPIELQNMHADVTTVTVFCYLFDESGGYLRATASSTPQALIDGAFSGDVLATASGDPSIAEAARSYLCFMQFAISGTSGVHTPGPVPTIAWNPSEYVLDRLQRLDGAAFTYYYQAEF